MTNALASATYRDVYAGPVPATLVTFRTKRKGVAVVRFRWTSRVTNTGGFVASGFATVEGALAAARRHACFSDVALLTPKGWEVADTSVEA